MYESFYHLNGKPFQLNPDPEFYFGSQGHSSAYSYLKYGVFQGEGFMVITGEIGAGKTTLVRALLRELDPAQVVAAQIVSTQLEADDLLRSAALAFGLRVQGLDKAGVLATLEGFLTQLVAEGRRALLVIDEAQNLSPHAMEELRMLSNFQIGDRALLQSFLVGQPELRDLLRLPALRQLRQRIIASYHLGPMSAAETRGYIEHRLAHVGYSGDPCFSDEAFAAFFEASGGIPRRINVIANRVLLAGYLGEKHEIGAADVAAAAGELVEEVGTEIAPAPEVPGTLAEARNDSPLRPFALSSINARLDRLERGINQILEQLRAQNPPPAPRARVGKSARQIPQ
jgi:putative secretion ATPase (PEP-CTERM system associated)